jgi:anthranilate/para-aminobenzoate synthase component II
MSLVPGLEKETEEVFATSEEQRQAERYRKLVEAEAKIQADLEVEMKEREDLRTESKK